MKKAPRRVSLKEEFLVITGDHRKAIILETFVTNKVCHTNWWKIRSEDLLELTMLTITKVTLLHEINGLVYSGFLLKRNNPDKPSDKTNQYKLNVKAVNEALIINGYNPIN